MAHELRVVPRGETEIVMRRAFDAPRERVFEAFTSPSWLVQWFGVHADWTLPVCEVDLRVGGSYRYEWACDQGTRMGVSGTFTEVIVPERTVNTERFDESWYPGEATITHELKERDGQTISTLTVRYESQEARDMVMASPMEQGIAAGYAKLDALLASRG